MIGVNTIIINLQIRLEISLFSKLAHVNAAALIEILLRCTILTCYDNTQIYSKFNIWRNQIFD